MDAEAAGHLDLIQANGPTGSSKVLSVCKDVSARQRGRRYRVEAAAVIPEKTWIGVKCEKDRSLANLPGKKVSGRARRLNKSSYTTFPVSKSITQNPGQRLAVVIVHWKKSVYSYFSKWHRIRMRTISQSIA